MNPKTMAIALLVVTAFLAGLNVGLYGARVSQNQAQPALLPLQPTGAYKASVNIVAVRAQDGQGILNQGVVELRPGQQRVLFAINPFVEPDTQQSVEIAAQVAQQVSGKSLQGFELIYSVENTQAQLVGGPSAGAAFAIATVAAMQQKSVRSDAAVTGSVQPNGGIGIVGGVIEKANAAGQAGIKTFLVPKGQGVLTYYERKTTEERRGAFIIRSTRYVPTTLSLNDYTLQEYGMKTVEVANVQEAASYLIA